MKEKKILDMYRNIQSEEDYFTNEFNLNFRFLYFFDADDKGITKREDEINNELELSNNLKHNEVNTIYLYEWGCYIFHKDIGDLEDILLELMKSDNENTFTNSRTFLKDNKLDKSRQKEFICNDTKERYKTGIKFKEKKSIISVAGQLQFSGMNNSVIIAQSDYIRKSDIEDNTHCKDIIRLFSKK